MIVARVQGTEIGAELCQGEVLKAVGAADHTYFRCNTPSWSK